MSGGPRGWWIALEGGEGAGKSTQARLLAEAMGAVLTREPGGTALGERLRSLLLEPGADIDERAETLLMAADRAQHVARVVAPALARGTSVVSDRSAYSSLAYQGHGRRLGAAAVRAVSDWASGGRWPDLAVLLDLPADQADARRRRPDDRMEAAGDGFHRRVAEGFRELASADPGRWCVVDGRGGVGEVQARVVAAVDSWVADRG